MRNLERYFVEELMIKADIQDGGNRPWDIKINDKEDFYKRIVSQGRLGIAESYMDGVWEADHLDEAITKVFESRVVSSFKSFLTPLNNLRSIIFNAQDRIRSKKVAEVHYNLGNDFYKDMLGPTMQYTCAYYKDTQDLDTAQEQKLELICKKLNLKRGESLLELGGGFGKLANYIAENYGTNVVSYNISSEQVKFARALNKGLPVIINEADYRDASMDFNSESFDKVASIGLMEHVGYKNYRTMMETANHALKKNGLFLLHTIGRDNSIRSVEDPFIEKYIFPGGMIPSLKQISQASEGLFTIEDVHNFGAYYDKTLMAWFNNFDKNWERHKGEFNNPDKFYKMWEYYLKGCAGVFRSRNLQLFQVVLSKNGIPNGYNSIR